jgi:hypothetical protein
MPMVYQIMLFLLISGALVFTGFLWGRKARVNASAAAALPMPHPADFRQDRSFQAGFQAGHLQGWRDAVSQAAPPALKATAAVTPEPAPAPPAPQQVRRDLAEDGFVFHAQSINPVSETAHSSVPFVNERDRPWMPLTGPVRQYPSSIATNVPPTVALTQSSIAPSSLPPAQAQPAWSTPQESEDDRRARREKRDRQNINITLYIASLLLVAAGALFLGTNLASLLKFVGVCAITALFYIAGFVLHANVPRLRPAAVAFAGTGLALIPVLGLALYNFALHDGPIAWLATSLLGLAAYSFAAVRLESRVLAYLSLTFVVSSTWSGVSILGGALVWYFTAMIGLAVLLTLLTALRPRWLPPLYLRPLIQLHPLVVPAVAISVTLVPLLFTRAEYSLVMLLCGLYLAVVAATSARFRLPNFYGARAAFTAAAAAAVWHLTDHPSSIFLSVAALLALQTLGLGFGRRQLIQWFPGDHRRWNGDVAVTFAAQLLACWAWVVWIQFESGYRASTLPVWLPLLATLLTGMALAIRLRGIAEWMPVATIAVAASLNQILGAWQLGAFLVLTVLFWLTRAVRPSAGRAYFVLAARIAATLAAPLVVLEVMGESPQRIGGSLLAFIIAVAIQQLVSAGLLKDGIPTFAPNFTLAGSAAAGLIVLMALPFFDNTTGNALTGISILIQLGAALVVGWLSLLNRGTPTGGWGSKKVGEQWRPTVGELLPLAVSLIVVPLAFMSVSLASGNLSLLLAAAYVIVTAGRLSVALHRWAYWWMARGSLTVLALTSFEQLQEAAGPLVLAGQVITPPLVALLALALQLAFPLAAWHFSSPRARQAAAIAADVAIVLGLQIVALTVLSTQLTESGKGWPGTLGTVVVALSAAASGFVVRRHTVAPFIAPMALAILLVLRGGKLLDVDLILGTFVAYSAGMVIAAEGRRTKGAYFLGARVLTAALVVLLTYDLSGSASAISVSLALVLLAQHAIRWLMRNRLLEVPFQQGTVWVTLGLQAVLPLHDILQGNLSSGEDAGSLRWVVLLELLLLLASAIIASRFFHARGAMYLTVYAGVFGVVALGPLLHSGAGPERQGNLLAFPVLSHDGVALVLLALALAGTVYGILVRRGRVATGEADPNGAADVSSQARPDIENRLWLAASGGTALTACVVSPLADEWIAGMSILVVSMVCFVASHLERLALLYPAAAVAALVGANITASSVVSFSDDPWGSYVSWLAGCGLAAAVMYLGRWAKHTRFAADPVRRWALAGGGIAGLALVAVRGLGDDATAGTAAALVAAVAFACWLEAPARLRRMTAELGALAVTASLQRAVLFSGSPGSGPDPFWTAQWFVVLAALLAVLRFAAGQIVPARVILGAGATLLSLTGIAIVFGGTSAQQLWVLVLLAILLLAGVARNERLFVWWGAAGVTLCLMWAMRQYTFALLALIAVALIIFAVWRLNRTKPTDVLSSGTSGTSVTAEASHSPESSGVPAPRSTQGSQPPLPAGAPERALNGEGPVNGP